MLQRTTYRALVTFLALGCGGEASRAPARPPVFAPPAVANAPRERPPAPVVPTGDAGERLRSYAETRAFHLGTPQGMTPTPDGQAVLFLRSGARSPKQSLFEMDMATGLSREILSPSRVAEGEEQVSPAERARRERMRVRTTGFTSFELSLDGASVLTSLSGKVYLLRRASGETHEIAPRGAGADPDKIDPHLSPDGKRVAYVRGRELYVAGAGGEPEVQLTRGGTDAISRGAAEFIAQEELDRSRGFWFSPNGSRVVYEEADTSGVERFTIADPAHPESAALVSAYPRPGKANAKVRFGIVSVKGGATTWVHYDHDAFPYVATVTWPSGGPLMMYVLDREQKNGVLFAVDATTGATKTLLAEHDDLWLNVDPNMPAWVSEQKGFLWSTERAGGWRVELHDPAGALVRELGTADVAYREIVGVDPVAGEAYVVASTDPAESGIYALPLDGGKPRPLLARPGANYAATMGSGHAVFAGVETTLTTTPRFFARNVTGGGEHALPSVAEHAMAPQKVELVTTDPDRTRVAVIRPRSFQEGRTYPVIDAAYAGPHVALVAANAERYVLDQWMADETGSIVVVIDARGTPHRGRDWERSIYHRLGEVPLSGHIRAIQSLAGRFPEMDSTRVGVFGWSFGGYFSALAVLARPDFYRAAVAAAPPADWRDYDTCYTERYLGTPESDPEGYAAASLLTYAEKEPAPGMARPLLIVHGTADDNVYFFNSLKLIDALERARRPFELFPVSGMTHIPRDPLRVDEVWTRAAGFFRRELSVVEALP